MHGLVDLLSHHLYSSPRVYLRELLQKGVDAITARRALDPGAPVTCGGSWATWVPTSGRAGHAPGSPYSGRRRTGRAPWL